jgi:hypothetical protein
MLRGEPTATVLQLFGIASSGSDSGAWHTSQHNRLSAPTTSRFPTAFARLIHSPSTGARLVWLGFLETSLIDSDESLQLVPPRRLPHRLPRLRG